MAAANGRAGFNAEDRAKERESGPIVLGGVSYHQRRLTNRRLREVRGMSRAAAKEAREIAKETDEYREAYDAAIKAGETPEEAERRATLEAQLSDQVDEINERSLVEQLTALLVDDAGQPLTEERAREHLESDLDARDTGPLMEYLLGADPTEESTRAATPTSST